MALITLNYVFTVGTTIIASQTNLNNSVIYSDYNGNITDDNIASGAAIAYTKLALNNTIKGSDTITPNTANNIVVLNGSTQIPAVDGSLLTNTPLVKLQVGSPSSASSIAISSLSSGIRYKLILNLLQNTSNGLLHITFNGDTGSNYAWAANGSTPTTQFSLGSDSGATFIGTGTADSSSNYLIEAIFQTAASSNNIVQLNAVEGFVSTGNHRILTIYGYYGGSTSLSTMTITPSAGTISGNWVLYQLN